MKTVGKFLGAALAPLCCVFGVQVALAAHVNSVCTGPQPNACPATLNIVGPPNTTATVTGTCTSPILLRSVSHLTNIKSGSVILTGPNSFVGTFVKLNDALRATFQVDLTLNGSFVCAVDPAFATLEIVTGRSAIQILDEIPKVERYINIANGDPGLNEVLVLVNGRPFRRLNFRRRAGSGSIDLDAGSLMTREKNTLTFIGRGRVGASANILVTNGAPGAASARNDGRPLDWARPDLVVEDNAAEQSASVSTQEIHINVATALDRFTAQDAARYQVTVKNARAAVTRVSAAPGADATSLTLKLPAGSFVVGDAIRVDWRGVRNAEGRPLTGHVDVIAE